MKMHLVMRIGKFRVQYQTKLWIVFHLAITKPHRPTFLDGVSADDRIKNWINGFVDVLQQHSVASYDRPLYHVQVIPLSESHHKQLRVASWTSAFSECCIPCLTLRTINICARHLNDG